MITASAIFALLLGPVFAEARLPAGTVLEPSILVGEEADIEAMVGREVKRTIYPGKIVSLADTKEADLVERNAFVRMIATKGQLRIETRGRALGEGAAGAQIRVMNLESKRTVIGTIVGENLVEVGL